MDAMDEGSDKQDFGYTFDMQILDKQLSGRFVRGQISDVCLTPTPPNNFALSFFEETPLSGDVLGSGMQTV